MAELNAEGWRVGYRDIIPATYLEKLPVDRWLAEMTDGLRSPRGDSFTRIAEIEGEAVGYCFVAAPARDEPDDSRIAELVALYVDPGSWRRGVGRALVEAVLAHAETLPYDEIYLRTFEVNEPAIALYRALGFELEGARRPFVPTGTPTVRMRRAL